MLKDYREKIISIEQHQGKRNIKLREAYNQLASELNEAHSTNLENDEIRSVVGHVTNVMSRLNKDGEGSLESAMSQEFGRASSLSKAQQSSLRQSLQRVVNPGLSGGGSGGDISIFKNDLEKVIANPTGESARGLWDLYNSIVDKADSSESSAVHTSAITSVLGALSDNTKLQGYVNSFLDSEYLSDVVDTELLPGTIVESLKRDFTNKNARTYLERTVNAILSDSDVGQAIIQGGGQESGMGRVITAMNTFGMNTDMVIDIMRHTLKGDFRQTVNLLMDHFIPNRPSTPSAPASIYPSAQSLNGGGGSLLMDLYESPYDVFQRVFDNPDTVAHSSGEFNDSAIHSAQEQFVNSIQSQGQPTSSSVIDLARGVVKGVLTRDSETMELLHNNKELLVGLFGQK
jgi:hypothetical protein